MVITCPLIIYACHTQSPIATNMSEFCLGEVYSIQHYVIKFVSDLWQIWFSPGTPVSSTNKTGCHNIVESGVKHHNHNHTHKVTEIFFIVHVLSIILVQKEGQPILLHNSSTEFSQQLISKWKLSLLIPCMCHWWHFYYYGNLISELLTSQTGIDM